MEKKETLSNQNRIKQLRLEQHKTQKEVGKAVGLSDRAIAHYERGIREPKLATWLKLAEFFGVSVSYLQGVSDVPFATLADYMKARGKKNLPELLSSVETEEDAKLIEKIAKQQERYQSLINYDKVANFLDNISFLHRTSKDKELSNELDYDDEKKVFDYFDLLARLNIIFIRALKTDNKDAKKYYKQTQKIIRSFRL